jgi:hypothetical protein
MWQIASQRCHVHILGCFIRVHVGALVGGSSTATTSESLEAVPEAIANTSEA